MKIGFTSVTSRIFHAGYVLMFEECKKYCDYLIVGIIVDHSDRPEKKPSILTPFEKYILVKNCKDVDEVIPLGGEKDLELALSGLQIDVRFVGHDYFGKSFTGKEICQERNIDIRYNNRMHELSSTELIDRAVFAETNQKEVKPLYKDIYEGYNIYNASEVIEELKKDNKTRVRFDEHEELCPKGLTKCFYIDGKATGMLENFTKRCPDYNFCEYSKNKNQEKSPCKYKQSYDCYIAENNRNCNNCM